MSRSIQDISNKTFAQIKSDYQVAMNILSDLADGTIAIEDPMIEDSVRDPNNQLAFSHLLHIMARLGGINRAQLGEVRTCIDSNDSLVGFNQAVVDTVGGIQTKTSSLRAVRTPYGISYFYLVEFTGDKKPEKVHIQCYHNGRTEEAMIDLIENPCGKRISINADRNGVVVKTSKWGRFFS